MQVADDAVVGDAEDRRERVVVDGQDARALVHAGAVLHGAADAAGDVELGTDGGAGLADLVVVGDPARIHGGAAGADDAADRAGQLLDQREALARADPDAAGDDDARALEVDALLLLDALHQRDDEVLVAQHHAGADGDALLGARDGHGDDAPVAPPVLLRHDHDALAHGGHLRPVQRADDGGDDVAAERRPDLVEQVLVLLALERVVADAQVGAVGGEAGAQGAGHARREVAAGGGGAVEDDLRLVLADEAGDDLRVRLRQVLREVGVGDEVDGVGAAGDEGRARGP